MPRSSYLIALLLPVTLAGCGTPAPVPSPTPTYAVTGDSVLRIGSLVPTSSPIGASQVAGIEAAIREINEAGGVNGAPIVQETGAPSATPVDEAEEVAGLPVEAYHRNSGDETTETAVAAYAGLLAKGVDVVIGPSSAVLVEQLLDPVLEAGVPVISPASTSASLTGLADEGLVFRSIASEATEGAALAAAIQQAEAESVAYVYLDDEAGTALLASLSTAVGELATEQPFTAKTSDFSSIAEKVAKAKPDAVVISSATPERTAALLTALLAEDLDPSALWFASRSLVAYSALPAGALEGAHGLAVGATPDEAFAARLRQADPGVGSLQYAAEAYDAVILAALAATVAGDDGGPSIARALASVSSGGIPCTSFGACLDVLETESDIDYDGVSSPVDLSSDGDVTTGAWGVYSYGAANSFSLASTIIVAFP